MEYAPAFPVRAFFVEPDGVRFEKPAASFGEVAPVAEVARRFERLGGAGSRFVLVDATDVQVHHSDALDALGAILPESLS